MINEALEHIEEIVRSTLLTTTKKRLLEWIVEGNSVDAYTEEHVAIYDKGYNDGAEQALFEFKSRMERVLEFYEKQERYNNSYERDKGIEIAMATLKSLGKLSKEEITEVKWKAIENAKSPSFVMDTIFDDLPFTDVEV